MSIFSKNNFLEMLKKLPLNFAHITKRNFSSFQNPKIVKGPLFSQPLPLKPFGSLRFASNVPTTKEKGKTNKSTIFFGNNLDYKTFYNKDKEF